ncbi:hypothetical protein FIBSPDRAFT_956275 [Athelia psychrophila]|uniref:Uncharacterized protein n=1 Tax=Athelia psychrophila TaxID=1759441 RepID=A0A166H594_9AGAM|nr:hypothetical protein FIBSPDRAFT_956275 [Fibularhizoctonia sp. CBS 109695]
MQESKAHPPQMARRVPPHVWPDDIPEEPVTPQRTSASFFTEASGNSHVVNIYGDQHNTCEGLDCAEMHSQRTSLLQITQRLERHVADLEAQRNDGHYTITIAVNRRSLPFFLFV